MYRGSLCFCLDWLYGNNRWWLTMAINPESVKEYSVPIACLCVVICAFIVTKLVSDGLKTLQETRDLARSNAQLLKTSDLPGLIKDFSDMKTDIAILKERSRPNSSNEPVTAGSIVKKQPTLLQWRGEG